MVGAIRGCCATVNWDSENASDSVCFSIDKNTHFKHHPLCVSTTPNTLDTAAVKYRSSRMWFVCELSLFDWRLVLLWPLIGIGSTISIDYNINRILEVMYSNFYLLPDCTGCRYFLTYSDNFQLCRQICVVCDIIWQSWCFAMFDLSASWESASRSVSYWYHCLTKKIHPLFVV